MRVFVTGATGVLGQPVVRLLLEAGHHVAALCRSAQNVQQVVTLGAEAAEADLFDPDSLTAVMARCDAVFHLATHIPPVANMGKPGVWQQNDHIRREGTRSVVAAAERIESLNCIVYPSVSFMYADKGAEWMDATNAVLDTPGPLESTLNAEAEVERFGASTAARRALILRFGGFYGPASADSRQTLEMARKGLTLRVADRDAYKSMIWIDDAASAVMAAFESDADGTYDVVENAPSTQSGMVAALAAAVGRKRLWALPPAMLRLFLSTEMRASAGRSQRISNRRFREATGWNPGVVDQLHGWRMMSRTD